MVLAKDISPNLALRRCKLPATMEQSVRKRVRKARELERKRQDEIEALRASSQLAAASMRAAATTRAAATASGAAASLKKPPKHNFRHTSHQVDVMATGKHKWARATIDAYKKATVAYANLLSGVRVRGDGGAQAIADEYNKGLPHGATRLTASTIIRQVSKNMAGVSPVKRGVKRKFPQAVYDSVATYLQLKQSSGDEQKPRQLRRTVIAAFKGTPLESQLSTPRQLTRALKTMREDHADVITRANKCSVDDRRWQWTTYTNLNDWYDGWRRFLVFHEFATEEPETQPDGSVAEVTIPPAKQRRICNADETHHIMDTDGDRGGSRARTYVSRNMGRSGARRVANPKHITGLYITFAPPNNQSGPPFYFFDSDATDPENFRVDARWLIGLPRVIWEFADGSTKTFPVSFKVTPKGGMDGASFEEWLEKCVYPLFPDMSPKWEINAAGEIVKGPVVLRIDGGPGRLGPSSTAWRVRASIRGLLIFPGLQNATSVVQEMDDLYGLFQQMCQEIADEIAAERMLKRAREDQAGVPAVAKRTKVQLTNLDLGRIVNGRRSDPVEKCAFEFAFTPERIEESFRKIGAVPLTRAGLKHKKVRHEVADGDPANDSLLALEARHAANTAALEAHGANVEMLVAPLARRKFVERPVGVVAQLEALVERGVSHSTVWHTCGAVALDGDLVLAAEGVRAAAEHIATAAAAQQQSTELEALLEAALALERGRAAAGGTYASMNGEARATIIKCIFKIKHLTGFSKLASKATQLTFLDGQGDVGALLEAGFTPRASPPPAAASATSGSSGIPDTSDVDGRLLLLLEERRATLLGTFNATP